MTYKLVRAREVAGADPKKFNAMQEFFQDFLKNDSELTSDSNNNTGEFTMEVAVNSETGIEAMASGIIALKAAAQKADLHLYLQKVECDDDEGNTYHLKFSGICH